MAHREMQTRMPISVFRKLYRSLKSDGANHIADTKRNIRYGRPSPGPGRQFTFLAGRHFRDLAALRRTPGGQRAGRRTLAAHSARAVRARDAGRAADDGRGGDRTLG